jgi:hypothetical protein
MRCKGPSLAETGVAPRSGRFRICEIILASIDSDARLAWFSEIVGLERTGRRVNANGKKYLKNALYGFLAWLIPFVTSFFFYTREGKLTIDIFLFKSIMIVVGSVSAAFLLISYFKTISANHLREGVIVGLAWFSINIGLDLLVLIPMSGMSIPDYFVQIGLRYLVIPAMSIAVGAALENKK